MMKYLDNISDDDIVGLNIPNGVPLVYELDENLKPIKHLLSGRPGRDCQGASGCCEARQGGLNRGHRLAAALA